MFSSSSIYNIRIYDCYCNNRCIENGGDSIEQLKNILNLSSLVINYNIFDWMGSEKTTVGKKLSKYLKMNFVDTDYQIESIMSMSILNF